MSFSVKHVHLIGIGGINMSAIAKLLRHQGIGVSGSDASTSEMTDELIRLGIEVKIGHAGANVPHETDLILYSSAVPESNVERAEGRKRPVRQINNFQFLGEWTADARTLLVTGTHGKSTVTAMLGLLLEAGGMDPTVLVGSRVASFPEGNLRMGRKDFYVIEGDEFARHFLEFHPWGVIINNMELDHTDVYADMQAVVETFRELLRRVQDRGIVVANADDPQVSTLIGQERAHLEQRGVRIRTFGAGSHADIQMMDMACKTGEQTFSLRDGQGLVTRHTLLIPGRMNAMNATAALTLARALGVTQDATARVFSSFRGVWRRFEIVSDLGGMTVVSDYGHHPTAVRATLEAARSFFPNRRVMLCFQPHHRNRTKHLFSDFVSSFDRADVLILCEIYDVVGRDAKEDAIVSSHDLLQAVERHDAERGMHRSLTYAADPAASLAEVQRGKKSGDVIIVMGAGDIYCIAKDVSCGMYGSS